jgi:type IV pilus assembly protein PilM
MAFRTTRKPLVGLDIEPSAVHAAKVSVNGRISVEKAASTPLEHGVVRDGEIVDVPALTEALRALFKENQLDRRVRIGVANQQIVVRTLELPPITDGKELAAAVRFSAQGELPMPLDQAVLDYHALGVTETEAGPRQRVLVVAARREMVERVVMAARDAGLRPEGVDLSAFAMIRALASGGDEPVLYLAIGGLTNLAVARGGECLFTRAIGGGSEALAIDLAERRGLTLEHARGWLAHVGLDAQLDEVEGEEAVVQDAREILAEGAQRIAAEVRNSVDFLHAGQGPTVQRAVLTGPALAIPGFSTALSEHLGLPVELGAVAVPEGVEPGRYTVAAGLAVAEAPAP